MLTDILFFFDYSSSFLFFGPIIPGHALFVFGEFRHDTIAIFLQRVDICIFRPCTVILHFGLNVFFHLWYLYLCCVCLVFTHPTNMPLVCTHFQGFIFHPHGSHGHRHFPKMVVWCCFYFIYFNSKDKSKTDNF